MINADGSQKNPNGSFGAIIRDSQGVALIAGAGSSTSRSITMLELQGIELGLKMAARTNLQSIMVGSDSKTAVHYLKNVVDPPWQALSTFRIIKSLMATFSSVDVVYIYRETHRAA